MNKDITNIPIPKENTPPRREFRVSECVFAWLCILTGYIFCKSVPLSHNSLGGFILIILLFVSATVVLKRRGEKIGGLPLIAAISALLLSLSLILSANEGTRFFSYTYSLIIFCYYLYAAAGNSLRKGFTDIIALDFFKALIMPFASLGQLFRALFTGRAKSSGRVIGKILIGIAIAFIPTAIVLALLSYDESFWELLCDIFDFDWDDIGSHILSIMLGVPVGMYFFGAYISAADKKGESFINEESCRKTYTAVKFLPAVSAVTAVIPLLFLYVVFFISQWDYYISGFAGILPADFSYAEYAREGFFQLCAVSAINLLAVVVLAVFMRRKSRAMEVTLKIVSLVFSVFTLVLISTALAKLIMYIDFYGLTPKRVYAAWFMLLLGLIFIIVAVKQFVPKFNALSASMALTVVLFAPLAVLNVDGYIAKYNAEFYLQRGELEDGDIRDMEELGLAAVPAMLHFERELSERGYNSFIMNEMNEYFIRIEDRYFNEDDEGLFSYTLPYIRAKALIEERNAIVLGGGREALEYDVADMPRGKVQIFFGNTNKSAEEEVSDNLGVEVQMSQILVNTDSHGDFHGDGMTHIVLRFSDYSLVKQIEASREWQALPPDDTVKTLLHGYEGSGPYLTDDEGKPLVPEITNGYYLLVDRQSDDERDILSRASFNFSLGVYDLDSDTLHYCSLDT